MRIVNDKIRDLNPASALHLTSENWQLIYSVVVVVPWSITRGATSPHAGLVTPRHRHQCGAAEPRQPAHCSFWRFLHQVRALTTSPASCRGAAGAQCARSHRSYSERPQRLSGHSWCKVLHTSGASVSSRTVYCNISIDIIHFINKYRYSASEKVFEYIPIDLFNQGRWDLQM